MPSKHPYIHKAEKGALLSSLDNGDTMIPVAKRARINIKTARSIKKRSDDIIIFCDEHNEPPLSLHDRCTIAPKSKRPQALSEVDLNRLDVAIGQDRCYRKMPQNEVAEELDIHVSQSTIRAAAQEVGYNRVKPTKKLALTPI